jgi:hypothetical protein
MRLRTRIQAGKRPTRRIQTAKTIEIWTKYQTGVSSCLVVSKPARKEADKLYAELANDAIPSVFELSQPTGDASHGNGINATVPSAPSPSNTSACNKRQCSQHLSDSGLKSSMTLSQILERCGVACPVLNFQVIDDIVANPRKMRCCVLGF